MKARHSSAPLEKELSFEHPVLYTRSPPSPSRTFSSQRYFEMSPSAMCCLYTIAMCIYVPCILHRHEFHLPYHLIFTSCYDFLHFTDEKKMKTEQVQGFYTKTDRVGWDRPRLKSLSFLPRCLKVTMSLPLRQLAGTQSVVTPWFGVECNAFTTCEFPEGKLHF